jgi:hypothetical protein
MGAPQRSLESTTAPLFQRPLLGSLLVNCIEAIQVGGTIGSIQFSLDNGSYLWTENLVRVRIFGKNRPCGIMICFSFSYISCFFVPTLFSGHCVATLTTLSIPVGPSWMLDSTKSRLNRTRDLVSAEQSEHLSLSLSLLWRMLPVQ